MKLNPVINKAKRDEYKFLDMEKTKRPKPAVPKDWAIIFSIPFIFCLPARNIAPRRAPAPIEPVNIPRVSGPPCNISFANIGNNTL